MNKDSFINIPEINNLSVLGLNFGVDIDLFENVLYEILDEISVKLTMMHVTSGTNCVILNHSLPVIKNPL